VGEDEIDSSLCRVTIDNYLQGIEMEMNKKTLNRVSPFTEQKQFMIAD